MNNYKTDSVTPFAFKLQRIFKNQKLHTHQISHYFERDEREEFRQLSVCLSAAAAACVGPLLYVCKICCRGVRVCGAADKNGALCTYKINTTRHPPLAG